MGMNGALAVLRVFMKSTDRCGWSCAVDALVERALRRGLAGATVLRGLFGFDAAGELLDPRPWAVSQPVPVVAEFVDDLEALTAFLPTVSEVVIRGLTTLTDSRVRFYRRKHSPEQPAAGGAAAPATSLGERGQLLRAYVGGSDTWEGQPLYRAMVLRAMDRGLSWAGAFRAAAGYGASGQLRTAGLFGALAEMPMLVLAAGRGKEAEALLPFLEQVGGDGTVTLEDVQVFSPGLGVAGGRL